ncbi:neurotrimin-like isoform X2 [Vespula squamosa]|uniref:Neurotrimin-like isoform X2 n=1 Tax=Vespula squamosa TaxID=30214 RepID=A0ABD2B883_VESSQ
MSTYLIFNQLRIIHPQFRPKSRTSVLEPSQNFLSNQDRGTKQRRGYISKELWLKKAITRLLSYFRKFKRILREWLLVIF